MNTVKNVHSPAGMGYALNGTKCVKLRDCPFCKYGTIDRCENDKGHVWWHCADCKRDISDAQVERIYGPYRRK